ncbi:MAG: YihY/virulence factor BrkB family protein [Clostridiales Family XIII bacterium]|jgi:membrane protein|nr:YihY/virulence factor BrkB family protein [Clostridiales Family XIII bacterium]
MGKNRKAEDRERKVRIRLRPVLALTVKKVMDPFYAGGAAEVAFFLLLSLVPTTILLAQILHLFTLSMGAIEDLLDEYLREDIVDVFMPLLHYNPSKAFGVVLVILALWGGSKALFSLMRISNYAYQGASGSGNPFFRYVRERFRAVTTIALVMLTFLFALYILVFGEVIVRIALRYWNGFIGQPYTFSEAWYTIRWVIALVLYFFMVLAVYYMLPNRPSSFSRHIVKGVWRTLRNIMRAWWNTCKTTLRLILPGGVFASLAMLFATWLYSYYIRYVASANFNILYGGLSSVVLLLVWFYVIAFILILGIQLNAAWAESKEKNRRESHE